MALPKVQRLSPQSEARPAPLNGGAGRRTRAAKLTPGERRAWRSGFLAGVEHSQQQLELFRIRFGARGVEIDAPKFWPLVTPSPAEAFTPQLKRRTA